MGALALALASSLIGSVSGAISFDWEDCGSAAAHAKVTDVTVTPEIPVPGDKITIVASVKMDKETSAIQSDLVLAKLIHNKFDGCVGKEFKLPLGIGTITIPAPEDGCPLAAGTHQFYRYVQLSENIPKASTTSKLSGVDQDGEEFICVSMTLTNGGPTPTPTPSPPAPWYYITSQLSGRCLDVPGGDGTSGNSVWLWECYDGESQRWQFDSGMLKVWIDYERCLDLPNGDFNARGLNMQIWDCAGWPQQQWSYDSDGSHFYTAATCGGDDGCRCLDMGGNTDNGASIFTWDCTGNENQQFSLAESLEAAV